MASFEFAFRYVMLHEDPTLSGKVTKDEGGVTRYGIASRYHPGVDVANLSLGGAREIYEKEYWLAFRLDRLADDRVGAKLLDCLVNPGQGFAKKIQAIVGAVPDGKFGIQTLAAIDAMKPDILITLLCESQYDYYCKHSYGSPAFEGLKRRAMDKPKEA
jgi:lysozyme family protein